MKNGSGQSVNQTPKSNSTKLKVLIIGSAVLVVAVIVAVAIGIAAIINNNRSPMTVNGYKVPKAEFEYFLNSVKGSVLSKLQADNVKLNTGDVWNSPIGTNKTAKDLLAQEVSQAVTKYEVLVQNGIRLKLTKREDSPFYADNTSKMSKNDTIYGPGERSPEMVVSEYVTDLTNRMTDHLFGNPSEKEQLEWLADNKEMHSKYDNFQIRPLTINYAKSIYEVDEAVQKEKYALINDIRDKALKGDDFKKLVDEYSSEIPNTKNGLMDVIIEGNIIRTLPDYLKFGIDKVKKSGEISDVIDSGTSFILFKVENRVASVEPTLETVGTAVVLFLKDSHMEDQMNKWIKEAKTVAYSHAYKNVG